MLERLLDHMSERTEIRYRTMEDVADEFRRLPRGA